MDRWWCTARSTGEQQLRYAAELAHAPPYQHRLKIDPLSPFFDIAAHMVRCKSLLALVASVGLLCNINSQVRSIAHAHFAHHRLLGGSPHSRSGAAAVVASSSSS